MIVRMKVAGNALPVTALRRKAQPDDPSTAFFVFLSRTQHSVCSSLGGGYGRDGARRGVRG